MPFRVSFTPVQLCRCLHRRARCRIGLEVGSWPFQPSVTVGIRSTANVQFAEMLGLWVVCVCLSALLSRDIEDMPHGCGGDAQEPACAGSRGSAGEDEA